MTEENDRNRRKTSNKLRPSSDWDAFREAYLDCESIDWAALFRASDSRGQTPTPICALEQNLAKLENQTPYSAQYIVRNALNEGILEYIGQGCVILTPRNHLRNRNGNGTERGVEALFSGGDQE